MSTEHCENNPDDLPDKRLELRPTTEADRTYIARLNFLTDTFGDEHGTVPAEFDEDFTFYVDDWQPERGGFIAWRGNIPAGGVGSTGARTSATAMATPSPAYRRSRSPSKDATRVRALAPHSSMPLRSSPVSSVPPASHCP